MSTFSCVPFGDARPVVVAAVVVAVAVVEPVGDREVEDLVDERVAHRVLHERGVVDGLGRGHGDVEVVAALVVAERDDVAEPVTAKAMLAPSGAPPAP